MKQIAKALLDAQKEMGNPTKQSKNPFFRSSYADLNSVREAVLPSLNAHGISVIQPMINIDGKNFVQTVLLHESGEMLESFTEIIYAKSNDAQAQGSGITYARRYGLQSMVCVGADDDDGNAASNPEPKKAPQAAQPITLPTPTQSQFNNMCAVAATEKERVKKAMAKYTLTPEQKKQLDDLMK